MIGHFFTIVLYAPIYNLLIFLVDILPGGDIGLAVIIVTIIVKLVIAPLTISALRTSRAMQAIQPKFKELQEKYKDDKELQAKETFALYKKYKINPFASILTLFIQLPVIIALYYVFRHEVVKFDPTILYSFVHVPAVISNNFLGFFPLTAHNIILAALAAITQFLQAKYAMPVPPSTGPDASASEQFNRTMAMQMRYMLPLFIGFIAYISSGAIALYFITTALFTLGQELFMRKLPKVVVED
ncbi:MAG: 60 kDa inner rane insertion protein preprotein translocase subunit YidC [Parcubacteria group bacterium]|jgi:YidC/Oxa1 family membrane protein insertase|nr:60 kDa inner rane insertion protein preprotein translocase subunit YidC [Parcubacteria group bacterium]